VIITSLLTKVRPVLFKPPAVSLRAYLTFHKFSRWSFIKVTTLVDRYRKGYGPRVNCGEINNNSGMTEPATISGQHIRAILPYVIGNPNRREPGCHVSKGLLDKCLSCCRCSQKTSSDSCRRCTDQSCLGYMRCPPALSAMIVWGTTPCWSNSQAVRLAPWFLGLDSST
jgi:hypothetical protein